MKEEIYCRMKMSDDSLKHLQKLLDNKELIWVASRSQILKLWKEKKNGKNI